MQRFAFTAVTPAGQRVGGEIRGRDHAEAVRRLLGRNCHPVRVEARLERRWTPSALWGRIFGPVGVSELAVFTRQLGILMKAGLPLVDALETLRRQLKSERMIGVTEDLRDMLTSEGGSLADALREHPRVFDRVYVSLIEAGEASGNLPRVLGDLAGYLYQAARLRAHVRGAFVYPVFLLLMGAAAVAVLMTFVIPKFQELFDSFGQDLPAPTRLLLVTSTFLKGWWWLVLLLLIVALAGGVFLLSRRGVRLALDRARLRLPVLGGMFVKLEMARMSHTLGRLLDDGVSIVQALCITGQTLANTALQAEFDPVARDVATGSSLAEAMTRHRVFPAMVLNLIRTGEETGELPAMLNELAAIYEDESERAVTAAVRLLEPVLIILIGGVIAAIVAAIMLPVFQANTMVQ